MTARRKVPEDAGIGIDMTPMIDCIFLLIVFFITAGKFKRAESRLDAYLSREIGPRMPPPNVLEKFFISVICLGEGNHCKWTVNDRVATSKSELVRMLRECSANADKGKSVTVSVDGNANVAFYWVVAALDACAEAQLTEIVFCPPRVPLDMWPKPPPKTFRLH
ncbi:MAG: biopolymer transporter ExbD [Candidatus Brocadiia bacterium]